MRIPFPAAENCHASQPDPRSRPDARARDAFLSVVVVRPYEMHPIRMANAILTLTTFCFGRAELVIGGGREWPEVMGVSLDKRGTGFSEALEFIRSAAYKSRGSIAHWATGKPPLLWGGASGPRMLHAAARAADGSTMSDIALPMIGAKVLPALA
ncbi:MAG: LLM class flavin-dependent oxidoreductase [Gammaproteobacteria bacterium]